METGPDFTRQRPAVWAQALLMGSLVFAGASTVLFVWF